MVQGFTRLGIPTTLLQKGARILPRDEPDLVDQLVTHLQEEGVDLRCNVETQRVTREGANKVVHGTENGTPRTWEAEELLVAVGRRPNVEHLGLEELGIETTPKAVVVDNRGRTSVETVYACGDLAGRHLFTPSAAYEGVRAVRDMFFPGKGKVVASVPWCTFTDPELAHAGSDRDRGPGPAQGRRGVAPRPDPQRPGPGRRRHRRRAPTRTRSWARISSPPQPAR
jgi:pyruvate/2-oxoglutarate dehydrogenase complex dihydrolipoamide dehydrogenase (E3) component